MSPVPVHREIGPGTSPGPDTRWAAITLAFLTPVATELLSGNVPARTFFLPWVYAALILTYGLPALLIRELYLAWKLSLPGLFLLGLAYGIFNEGVCAKTLLRSDHVPIDAFDHYGWMGINFPWAALIVPWHAVHAIVFPIALVTKWFPRAAQASWLSPGVCRWGSLFLIAAGALVHLANKKPATSPLYLVFFALVMAALIFLSKRASRASPFLGANTTYRSTLAPAVAGFSFYPVWVLGLSFCAGFRLPAIAICAVAILLLAFYYRLASRKKWLGLTPFVLFALGDYFSGSFLTGLIQLKTSIVGVITEALLAAFFGQQILAMLKSNRRES